MEYIIGIVIVISLLVIWHMKKTQKQLEEQASLKQKHLEEQAQEASRQSKIKQKKIEEKLKLVEHESKEMARRAAQKQKQLEYEAGEQAKRAALKQKQLADENKEKARRAEETQKQIYNQLITKIKNLKKEISSNPSKQEVKFKALGIKNEYKAYNNQYVYGHFLHDKIVYIGKGKNERYKTKSKGRSEVHKKIWDHLHKEIIIDNLNEDEALYIENQLITEIANPALSNLVNSNKGFVQKVKPNTKDILTAW